MRNLKYIFQHWLGVNLQIELAHEKEGRALHFRKSTIKDETENINIVLFITVTDKVLNNLEAAVQKSVLWKMYSENMQQIYRRISMPKYDFSKVAWVFSCKFAAYFQNIFS